MIIYGQIDVGKLIAYQQTIPATVIEHQINKTGAKKAPTQMFANIDDDSDIFLTLEIGTLEQHLIDDFIAWLNNQISIPWLATSKLLAYLTNDAVNVLQVYLKRDYATRPGSTEPYEWYFQFQVYGSSMTAASANVGNHWFCQWYQANSTRINQKYFAQVGFTATSDDCAEKTFDCLPLGSFGYGLFQEDNGIYLPAPENENNDADDQEEILVYCHFDIDEGFYLTETGIFTSPDVVEKLDAIVLANFQAGQCYCQLCQPQFQPPKIAIKQNQIVFD